MTFSDHRRMKRTRKPYRCVWCGERIDAGQPCDVVSGITEDNEMASVRYHPECYAALHTLPYDERDLWEWGDFHRGCTCQAGFKCTCKTEEVQQ